MAQYEWVDVRSMKRWGDPSTEGSIGGSFGKPSTSPGFQWGETVDFSVENKFASYTSTNASFKKDTNSGPSLNFSDYIDYRDGSTTVDTIICEEFDRFSALRADTFKRIELTNVTSEYGNWCIYFVLEDGSIICSEPYPSSCQGITIRRSIVKTDKKDERMLGKLMICTNLYDHKDINIGESKYQHRCCFINGYNNKITPGISQRHVYIDYPNPSTIYGDYYGESYILNIESVKFLSN